MSDKAHGAERQPKVSAGVAGSAACCVGAVALAVLAAAPLAHAVGRLDLPATQWALFGATVTWFTAAIATARISQAARRRA